MDRFFFHIDYGETTRDDVGTELPNLQAARSAAVELVGEMLRDQRDQFWAKPDLTVTVADARNLTLWTLTVTGCQAPSVTLARPTSS